MKKIALCLMALVMVFSFAACGEDSDNNNNNGTETAKTNFVKYTDQMEIFCNNVSDKAGSKAFSVLGASMTITSVDLSGIIALTISDSYDKDDNAALSIYSNLNVAKNGDNYTITYKSGGDTTKYELKAKLTSIVCKTYSNSKLQNICEYVKYDGGYAGQVTLLKYSGSPETIQYRIVRIKFSDKDNGFITTYDYGIKDATETEIYDASASVGGNWGKDWTVGVDGFELTAGVFAAHQLKT